MKKSSRHHLAVVYLKRISRFEEAIASETKAERSKALWSAGYAAADRVEVEWAQMRRDGEVRALTQDYRARRLKAEARGERIRPWAWFEAEKKRELVRALADVVVMMRK